MFDTDFKKIGELFFNDPTEKYESVSLHGFLTYAFKQYAAKFLQTSSTGLAQTAFYTSDNKRTRILLDIISPSGFPDLTGLTIEAEDIDFSTVMKNLRGRVSAEYSGVNGHKIEEITGRPVAPFKVKNRVQIGPMGIYFSQDPSNPDLVQRAVLETEPKLGRPQQQLFLGEEILNDSELKILSEASVISVDHVFSRPSNGIKAIKPRTLSFNFTNWYASLVGFDISDNPGASIQEQSRIIHPEEGKYNLLYKMWATSNEGLPGYMLPRLEEFFNFFQTRFSKRSFKLMKLREPNSGFAEVYHG